jgi:ABC-type uncharacterized transport system substrate-binding protein
MIKTLGRIALVGAMTAGAGAAEAHPHVWVTMHSEILFAPNGAVTGVRHHWAFDDMFSAFAVQGMPQKTKGTFTREELAPLAEINVTSLKEYDFFTYAKADGRKEAFKKPVDYWLDYKNSLLILNFTLPFQAPVKAKALALEVYDPTIFVDFEFAKKNPVVMTSAPAGCKLSVSKPQDLSVAQGQQLGEAFFNQLSTAGGWAAQFANHILVMCP